MSTEIEKEFSIKILLSNTKEWLGFLLSNWLIIGLMIIIGAVGGICYAWFSTAKYTAETTFVLSSNSDENGLASIAGQFGFDLSSNSDDAFSGDNIIVLLKSRRMMTDVLFSWVPGSEQTILNRLIDTDSGFNAWKKSERFKAFFPFPNRPEKLSLVQDSLLREIAEGIAKSNLKIEKVDKKLSYYKVSITTPNEQNSVLLANALVDVSSKFYIDTKTRSSKQNLALLQHEADSLSYLLNGTITTTAQSVDRTFNLNPAYQIHRADIQEGQYRANVVGSAYGDILKNLEIAKLTVQKETPLYQIIDTPQLPLIKIKMGRLFGALVGGFIFGLIAICILIGIRIYRNMLINETLRPE